MNNFKWKIAMKILQCGDGMRQNKQQCDTMQKSIVLLYYHRFRDNTQTQQKAIKRNDCPFHIAWSFKNKISPTKVAKQNATV